MMKPMPAPDNITSLTYRINAVEKDITYRVSSVEKDVADIRTQLDRYVLVRENDLRLQSVQESIGRVEDDVKQIHIQLVKLTDSLTEQDRKLTEQDNKRNKLLIKILWGAVSFVLVIVSGVLIYYFTHLG